MTRKSASGLFLPNRREVLSLAAGAAALVAMPSILRADAPYKKSLRLQSLNSGEKLTVTYWTDEGYDPEALKRVSWFMRDLRTGDVHDVHPELLDLLWEIDSHTRSKNPIYAMSGYRSPKTNAWLDARGNECRPRRLSHARHGDRHHAGFRGSGRNLPCREETREGRRWVTIHDEDALCPCRYRPTGRLGLSSMPRPARDEEHDLLQAVARQKAG